LAAAVYKQDALRQLTLCGLSNKPCPKHAGVRGVQQLDRVLTSMLFDRYFDSIKGALDKSHVVNSGVDIERRHVLELIECEQYSGCTVGPLRHAIPCGK
jgi:hypothetical protein